MDEQDRNREAYLAPRNQLEKELCGIWQEVLGLEQVGVEDNFFTLGGHSLLLIKLRIRITEVTGYKLELGDIFENATVSSLSKHLVSQSESRSEANSGNSLSLVLMFPGDEDQQLYGIGDFYEEEPIFREAFDRCALLLSDLVNHDIRRFIRVHRGVDEGDIQKVATNLREPLSFSISYSLARWWLELGIPVAY